MKSIQRLLIVKTSSMGDVIHMLPAVTDIARMYPDLQIDWAVEEGFAHIPAWHPAVKNVIPVAVRRWRKHLFTQSTWKQVRLVRKQLREANYDLVMDSQGLLKSAVVASWAKSPVAGMDKQSAREPIAARFYQHHYPVRRGQHAVPRNRQLAAQVMEYSLDGQPLDYGVGNHLQASGLLSNALDQQADINLPQRFMIFLHAASTTEKEWPVPLWIRLGQEINAKGFTVLLPWGNHREHVNARAIANGLSDAQVLPRLGLNELAALFLKADMLVGEDSGLSHMAAALDKPVVALYLVTDPALTGVMGSEVSKDTRVVNLEVTNDKNEVARVIEVIDGWLPGGA